MQIVEEYHNWGRRHLGHMNDLCQKLMAVAKYVRHIDCANYLMSNKEKLVVASLQVPLRNPKFPKP